VNKLLMMDRRTARNM